MYSLSDLTQEEVTRELEYASGLRPRPTNTKFIVGALAIGGIWYLMSKRKKR